MSAALLEPNPSVLIVDSSEDNREVLQTALTRRGWRTFTAKHAGEGAELVRQHHPNLIVCDYMIAKNDFNPTKPPFWEFRENQNIPLIILGTVPRKQPGIPHGEFISQPYHYAPLIRKIEDMLSSAPSGVARQS
ncbi:MAG: response regulator [Thermoguttaceae bacterium]